MSLSTLDPKTALIVIDLQKGVVTMPVAHPIDEIVQRSANLAAAFREHGLPVVLVNADGRAPGRTEVEVTGPSPPTRPPIGPSSSRNSTRSRATCA